METRTQYKMKQITKSIPFFGSERLGLIATNAFLFALVLLCLTPMRARADVNFITVSPQASVVPFTQGGAINLTWSVNRTETAATIARTISSPAAELRINGSTVATVAGAISKLGVLRAPAGNEVVVLNETINISSVLADKIGKAAPGTVQIRRVFSDEQTSLAATANVFSKSDAAGDIQVRRIELSFENDARTDIVHVGDNLHAVADIAFRNNGLLRGEWRIVDASASLGGGTAGRRVLQVVRQQLVSSGQGRTRIVSPPLPTKLTGLHLVSFSVEDTDGDLDVPILRYFVLEGKDGKGVVIDAISPAENASLNKDTMFSWKPVAGALAYQVEIFKDNPDTPLTGKLVTGKDLKLSLLSLSLSHLQSGESYEWRVRAFGKNGHVLGTSDPRTLNVP